MKTWIKVLIMVIITGGLVGGATYYLVNKKVTKDKNNLQSQIDDLNKKLSTATTALTAAQTVKAVADETAGWKTYSNNDLKISFKYPADWGTLTLEKSSSSSSIGTGSVYSSKASATAFSVNVYSSNYTSPAVFSAYSKPVNLNWTKEQFSSNVFIAGGTVLGMNKISTKGLFLLNYSAMECSPGMNTQLYVPTKNSLYPNVVFSAGSSFSEDPSIKAYEAKQQAAGADACDQKALYQAIADKVMAGTYSDKEVANKKTLELIAGTYSDLN